MNLSKSAFKICHNLATLVIISPSRNKWVAISVLIGKCSGLSNSTPIRIRIVTSLIGCPPEVDAPVVKR